MEESRAFYEIIKDGATIDLREMTHRQMLAYCDDHPQVRCLPVKYTCISARK